MTVKACVEAQKNECDLFVCLTIKTKSRRVMQMVVVPVVNTFPRIKIKNINERLTVIRNAQPAIKVNLKIIR